MTRDNGPRKGDRVRWTCVVEGEVDEVYETAIHLMDSDGRRRVLSTVDRRVSVEVLERADDPSKASRGEVREIDGMAAVCYGKDMWVYFSALHHGATGGYGVYKDAQMIGAPVIGVVPHSPAAEEFVPDWERELIEKEAASARPSVRVVNEPHGIPVDVRRNAVALLEAGNRTGAIDIIHQYGGLEWPAARRYVEGMSEYQSYLSEHGETKDRWSGPSTAEPPTRVRAVVDVEGDILSRRDGGWVGDGRAYATTVKPWSDHVLPKYGPYREVPS